MKYSKNDISRYLALPITVDGLVVKSPLIACLQDARGITARDINTGKKIDGKKHGCWLGALGYMVFIDHIGGKFALKDKKIAITYNSDFERALLYFSNLSEEEISVLYALRCSFAHDYFLFNTNSKERLNHHFTVTAGESGLLVVLPRQQWDGKMENRNENNKTVVNLELLGDLAEEIYNSVISNVGNNNFYLKNGTVLEYIQHR